MTHADSRLSGIAIFLTCSLILGGCSTSPVSEKKDGLGHTPPSQRNLASIPDAVPRHEPLSRYGNPKRYKVFGKEYRTLNDCLGYRKKGIASWYGSKFHGRRTSSGEPYDMFAMTAAHKTLPLPCYARVTNLKNGRSVIIRINDRGPFHGNRLIDLSYTAAWKLGIIGNGTGQVEVTTIDPRTPQPLQQDPIRLAAAEPVPAELPEPLTIPEVVQASASMPGLFLQVGAFGNIDNAQRLKNRLETELQTAVLVEQHHKDNIPIYRVRVGPIESREVYDQLAHRLTGMGFPETRLVMQ